MQVRRAIPIVCVLVMSACSTVAVERAQGVSVAGKAYVDTLERVDDLALDNSIEFTARLLPKTNRTDQSLAMQTDEIKHRVELIGQAHGYLEALASYFSGLEALAKGDQSDATAKALGDVADALKAAPINLKLSDPQKSALTGLAAFVGKQVHAAAVEKALVRDADTVAQALLISEKMLDEEISWINLREKAERQKKYLESVQRPFVSGAALGPEWERAWSDQVRTPPVIALLSDAKKASVHMQEAWVDVLRGQYSNAEIMASLANVRSGIEAITALKDAKQSSAKGARE